MCPQGKNAIYYGETEITSKGRKGKGREMKEMNITYLSIFEEVIIHKLFQQK